jgi:hypothetical protein
LGGPLPAVQDNFGLCAPRNIHARPCAGGRAERERDVGLSEELAQTICESGGVIGWEKPAGDSVGHGRGVAGNIAGKYGPSAGHGFQYDVGHALVGRRVDHDVGALVMGAQLAAIEPAMKMNYVIDLQRLDSIFHHGALRAVADQVERE